MSRDIFRRSDGTTRSSVVTFTSTGRSHTASDGRKVRRQINKAIEAGKNYNKRVGQCLPALRVSDEERERIRRKSGL